MVMDAHLGARRTGTVSCRSAGGVLYFALRLLLGGLSALEFLAFGQTAHAQTVLTATDAASFVSALTTVDNNPGTSYQINITQNITLTGGTTLPAIVSNSTVTISGSGNTLDGGGVQRGFFVYTGTVAINNLTIQNAVANGGNGGNGSDGGGGGGMG